MASKNTTKNSQKSNNPNKAGKTNSGKGARNNKHGTRGVVNRSVQQTSTLVTPSLDVPIEKLPIDSQSTNAKKWCLKDVSVFQPVIKKWYFKDKAKIEIPVTEQSSYPLTRNTIVDLLHQSTVTREDADLPSSSYSGITYEKTIYDVIDAKTGKKDWLTTKVAGWVNDASLDDYIEEFPKFEVVIPNQSRKSTDAEQVMTIIDEEYDEFRTRNNMCGELSVAFIVKEVLDPDINIDTVLAKWRESGVKNKEGINENYANLVGKGSDKALELKHLKEILDLYYTNGVNKKIEPYKVVWPGKPVKVEKIPLAASAYDDRHASTEFQMKLLEYYFIALVTINPNTGELIPNVDPKRRNHWVVVDKITRNGVRVELYNPSPNKRQSYSFREFFSSVGSNPNSGWWVERKRCLKADKFAPSKAEVMVENPTPETTDAEQYMKIDGARKTNLCGEFCVAYILNGSLDAALARWMEHQKNLKKQGGRTANIWELATILQAYGFNTGAPDTPDSKAGINPYSIDSILKYWKAIQPDLYGSILGGGNNETTDVMELLTILKAYGYNNMGDYIFGGLTSSPGRDADMLKKHYLIAGVKIDTGKKGRLKSKLGDGVDHWVVVNEITPAGNLVGGNGGWVNLYNPYPNVVEEYSYKEFMESYSGGGLWVKKDVTPTFTWQYRVPARRKGKKGSEKEGKTASNKMSQADLLKEIKKKGEEPIQGFAKRLANKSGWGKDEIVKLMTTPQKNTRKSLAELERLVCAKLGMDSISREISRWIRDRSGEDMSFAVELTSALRQFGILVIQDRKGRIVNWQDPAFPDVIEAAITSTISDSTPTSQLARKVASAFTGQVIDQLREIKPIEHAYKIWAEYVEWEKTIAVPGSNMYRVRRWGDPEMTRYGFDTNDIATGNFQAVGLYNEGTGFGAVTNYIRIQRDDIDELIDMQFDEIVDDKKMTVENKMNWLCQPRGRIYMFDSGKNSWQRSAQIRWGTIALGGNLVQVVERKEMNVKIPGEEKASRHWMARLAGFRKSDWSRPLDELLALGLVHRCFVANDGNVFADTSRGIVYSPFFSLLDWDFGGTDKPDALWIPFEYLEKKVESKPDTNLEASPESGTESGPKAKPKPNRKPKPSRK